MLGTHNKYSHGENFEVMLTTDLEFDEIVWGTNKESYNCLVVWKPFEKVDKKLFEENLKRFEDTNPIAFQQLKEKFKAKLQDSHKWTLPKDAAKQAAANIQMEDALEDVHHIFNEPLNHIREDDGLD
jgi:hypothetical protein